MSISVAISTLTSSTIKQNHPTSSDLYATETSRVRLACRLFPVYRFYRSFRLLHWRMSSLISQFLSISWASGKGSRPWYSVLGTLPTQVFIPSHFLMPPTFFNSVSSRPRTVWVFHGPKILFDTPGRYPVTLFTIVCCSFCNMFKNPN